jgi:hypothetical protein
MSAFRAPETVRRVVTRGLAGFVVAVIVLRGPFSPGAKIR